MQRAEPIDLIQRDISHMLRDVTVSLQKKFDVAGDDYVKGFLDRLSDEFAAHIAEAIDKFANMLVDYSQKEKLLLAVSPGKYTPLFSEAKESLKTRCECLGKIACDHYTSKKSILAQVKVTVVNAASFYRPGAGPGFEDRRDALKAGR